MNMFAVSPRTAWMSAHADVLPKTSTARLATMDVDETISKHPIANLPAQDPGRPITGQRVRSCSSKSQPASVSVGSSQRALFMARSAPVPRQNNSSTIGLLCKVLLVGLFVTSASDENARLVFQPMQDSDSITDTKIDSAWEFRLPRSSDSHHCMRQHNAPRPNGTAANSTMRRPTTIEFPSDSVSAIANMYNHGNARTKVVGGSGRHRELLSVLYNQ